MPRVSHMLVCLVLAWSSASPGMSITPAPDGVVIGFVAAWNSHSPAAFGQLMAADADWVTASGQRLRGREPIQEYLAEEHATWAKTTTMKALSVHVRLIDDKTAVVMFEWQIRTPGAAGAEPTVTHGNNLFVAVKNGDWLIVSGQVARARPR